METSILWIDLETRSKVDLIKHGLARYSQDPTTQIICLSYAFDDGDITTWFDEDGEAFPQDIIDHINDGKVFYAQNASFERNLFDFVISSDYGIKPPSLTQWRCSAARALAHGLPASLGDICRALDLPLQKQKEGMRLIRDYCAPGFLTVWKEGDRQLMQDYCEMDVATMRQFCSVLRELSDDEWEQYHITEQMNDRGVPLDVPFAEAALGYSEDVKIEVASKIQKLTNGAVLKPTSRKTRDAWLFERITDEQKELLAVKKEDGTFKYSLDKEHRGYLANAENLHPEAEALLQIMEEAGGSAVSKYSTMVNTHVEGRVFGAMIWNGAGATGRYSSRGLQLQNFIRAVFKEPEPYMDDIMDGFEIDKPANTLGRLLRSTITCDEGLTFSDYSQIEARVLPWLTGDPKAEVTLDIFREGRDLYTESAVGMFDLNSIDDVDADLRQASKQGNLACGFGGGANAVKAMAKNYGLVYSTDKAETIKVAWRKGNPWAEPFWWGLKRAAQHAVRQPGTMTKHGKLRFQSDGKDVLWMMLPSGRCLAYLKPRFEWVEYPWGDEGLELTCLWGGGKPKAGQKWLRRTVNHLILAENATQGAAADIMRETIVRAEHAGLKSLFSVHDELVAQGECFDQLHTIMVTPPTWAEGLPIAADTQYSQRYGK
mgnify:FL=1